MNDQWRWQIFLQDTGADQTYLQWLISAWGWTLSVSLLAFVVALTFGVTMGVARTIPNRVFAAIGVVWTELFRNIPLLVQVFLWYHVVPAFIPAVRGISSFVLVVFALGFYTSARIAEQVRAGIESLPRGQLHAGLAIGLTLPQTYRYVLLPMAGRILMPTLTSEAMSIIKNSSVGFAVSIAELSMFAMQAQEETSRGVEIYLAVTALYFVSSFAVNRLMLCIENYVRIPGAVQGER